RGAVWGRTGERGRASAGPPARFSGRPGGPDLPSLGPPPVARRGPVWVGPVHSRRRRLLRHLPPGPLRRPLRLRLGPGGGGRCCRELRGGARRPVRPPPRPLRQPLLPLLCLLLLADVE